MSNVPLDALRQSPVWDEIDGGTLLVACSGGADSVALLRAGHQLLEDPAFKARFSTPPSLAVWHFDHRARLTSQSDAAFVAALARKLEVPFLSDSAQEDHSSKPESGFEASARRERYAALLRILKASNEVERFPMRALTAHHLEDQAETVLHHLIRGTHLPGLRGVSPVYQELIHRPWLGVSQEQIRAYLTQLGQKHIEDETNLDEQFTRNRLRRSIFPVLTELNPRASAHIARLANLARIAVGQIEDRLQALPVVEYSKHEIDRWLPLIGWPLGKFSAFRLPTGWDDQELLAQFVIHQLSTELGQPDYQACDLVSDWATQPDGALKLQATSVQLAHPTVLTITHTKQQTPDTPVAAIECGHNQAIAGLTVLLRTGAGKQDRLQLGQPAPWQHIRYWPDALAELVTLPPDRASWQCALPKELDLPLTLRAWLPGDRIVLANGGTKKLQDVFTDAKVPALFKSVWAVLVDARNEVLWVPALADSEAMLAGKQEPHWLLTIRDNR